MIERTRRVCREDERLAAAMMYGSFAQGEGDGSRSGWTGAVPRLSALLARRIHNAGRYTEPVANAQFEERLREPLDLGPRGQRR